MSGSTEVRGILIGGVTDVGRKRQGNEDTFMVFVDEGTSGRPDSDVYADLARGSRPIVAVCDGMGGAAAGEMASRVSAETMGDRLRETDFHHITEVDDLLDWLEEGVEEANWRIRNRSALLPELHGMGSTMSVVALFGSTLALAHVGDSRIYLLRGGVLRHLTEDQTLVSRMLADGALTPEQALKHEDRHVLLQAIGTQDHLEVQRAWLSLQSGDVLLLCSDGLYEMVEEEEIRSALSSGEPQGECAQTLVDRANENGGHDNITAVVAHLLGMES
jgi:PPM family protein phosphatase